MKMLARQQADNAERGQALLELVIILPLFLFLTGAIIGIGWSNWTRPQRNTVIPAIRS